MNMATSLFSKRKLWNFEHENNLPSNHPILVVRNDSQKFTNLPEDLHIFISDFNQFVQPLQDIFSKRSKMSKEFWLVNVSNVKKINKQLHDLDIDLDDDLYFYEQNSEKKSVQMWEVYRIHQGFPVKILQYGNWSDENGMQLENQFKWKRRNNLEVGRNFFNLTYYTRPSLGLTTLKPRYSEFHDIVNKTQHQF